MLSGMLPPEEDSDYDKEYDDYGNEVPESMKNKPKD